VVFALVFAREDTAGKGIVHDDIDTVFATARDKLGVDCTRDGIVHCLVYRGLHPAVVLADLYDLSDFPGSVVAEAKLDEFSFFVELVAGAEGVFEGNTAVRGVKVELWLAVSMCLEDCEAQHTMSTQEPPSSERDFEREALSFSGAWSPGLAG